MGTYNFKRQLQIGETYERILDHFYSRNFDITRATWGEQHKAIDRWYRDRNPKDGRVSVEAIAVEYKADGRAHATGNAFIEILSDVAKARPGWARKSEARYLFYCSPDKNERMAELVIVEMEWVKEMVPRWLENRRTYPVVDVKNEGWVTRGILVPLDELRDVAVRIRWINVDEAKRELGLKA